MLQVKVTVKSTATGRPCAKFKVGDSWIVDWLRVTPGMCSRLAIDLTFYMQLMMQIPEKTVWGFSCPSCQNTDSVMIYRIQNLHPEKPIEKIMPIEPIP
jgi:uncharacterized repeat protein (TIGR04076 family)